jgi:hypothetical protein
MSVVGVDDFVETLSPAPTSRANGCRRRSLRMSLIEGRRCLGRAVHWSCRWWRSRAQALCVPLAKGKTRSEHGTKPDPLTCTIA